MTLEWAARPRSVSRMMRALLTSCLVAVVLTIAVGAGATIGGPMVMTPLGYDRATDRVYLVREKHDEGDDRPELHELPLGGRHAGTLRRVCPWTERPPPWTPRCATLEPERLHDAWPKRMERLAFRLEPLVPSTVTLALRTVRLAPVTRPDPKLPEHTWRGERLRVTLAPVAAPEQRSHAVVEHFPVGSGPAVHIASTHRIAGRRVLVAIVRYVGIPLEVGYTADEPMLVRF